MDIKRKYTVERLSFCPYDGMEWNAMVWISVDGGENYYHCGIGKYCKTREAAEAFCAEYERTHAN